MRLILDGVDSILSGDRDGKAEGHQMPIMCILNNEHLRSEAPRDIAGAEHMKPGCALTGACSADVPYHGRG